MKETKRYPFSMAKHEHDIFFRYNRAQNELHEKRMNGTLTDEEADRYETLINGLSAILEQCGPVAWLTGKEYGLAQETVCWAATMRKH